ncbi:4Fe-4S binding domain protein [Poriferisphaera corsica]|uniref:4Fe-4S binding domain protein n=1 Tax=Poriferisphaera corsica TaxID=2528020 RepID=A0A517YPF5_9BACT|nr:cytochrome c oxidase accessory protein CcoG [Poriferisphaera corsica]QDU32101.1 4Fe-4S binding domain protein [Poriferisphaera corsica]
MSEAERNDGPMPMESPEQVLTTLTKEGKRAWMYPRLSKGKYLSMRRWVAYLLIGVFTLLPYIKLNGKPFVLLDIVHRKFTIFFYTFLPTDSILLAMLAVSFFVGIFLVTAVFGRVWCGWACPQTVYMEFLYRPIERLVMGTGGKGGKPRDVGGGRYVLLYMMYFLASCFLAHTFLAYFVGVDALWMWIWGSPFNHPMAFLVMAAVTGLMMFDFAFFREQLCIIACPYGRFQSVLLDKNSLIVSYDPNRGEPRGKKKRAKKGEDVSLKVVDEQGDCIDCKMCVTTCPTGIDIRDGLQLECISCTQCIDACNTVMDKIGKPHGLIRYSSRARIDGESTRFLRPRVIIYPLIICLLLSIFVLFFISKQHAYVKELRQIGSPFTLVEGGNVVNIKRFKLINRDDVEHVYSFMVVDDDRVELMMGDEMIRLGPGEATEVSLRMIVPRDMFENGHHRCKIRISDDGSFSKIYTSRLLGPL